ncbi:extracellular ligand-gated ion channel [Aureococcus anophagefferens]|nr:extracellular ligand-gated ion channel [Aureococcus anophagefferens]
MLRRAALLVALCARATKSDEAVPRELRPKHVDARELAGNPYYVEDPVFTNRTTFLVMNTYIWNLCSKERNPNPEEFCYGAYDLYTETLKYDHLVVIPDVGSDIAAFTFGIPAMFAADPESVTVMWLMIYTPVMFLLTPLLQAGVATILISGSDHAHPTVATFGAHPASSAYGLAEPWWPAKYGDYPRLYKLVPDDYQGAYEAAREFCRLTNAEDRIHEIMLIAIDQLRRDGFQDGVAALCGDRGHVVVAEFSDFDALTAYQGTYDAMASYFTAYPGISIVLTGDVNNVRAVYDAAADYRSGGNAEIIVVDEDRGVHFTTQRLLDIVDAGEAVELALAKRVLTTAIQIEVFDMGAFIVRQLLPVYAKETAPSSPVDVRINLRRVRITEVTPTDASFFEITGIVEVEWDEPRLAWDDYLFNETLSYPRASIWTPAIYIDNNYFTRDFTDLPVEVSSSGRARMKSQIRTQLLCDSDLIMLPFDVHKCEITFESTRQRVFEAMAHGDFLVADVDDNYEIEYHATTTEVEGGFMNERHSVVRFKFVFSHRPFGHYIRLIFPAALLNMVGFLAFWVDGATDSLELGITTLLCTLALRQTIEFPDTTYPTWLEGFMFINILFQFICVVLSVSEYSEGRQDLLQEYIVKRMTGYSKLANQLGGAVTPTFMRTPRTPGRRTPRMTPRDQNGNGKVHALGGAPPGPDIPELPSVDAHAAKRTPRQDAYAPHDAGAGHGRGQGHGHGAGHHDHGPNGGKRRDSLMGKINPFASLQRLSNPKKYGEETTPAADLIGRWIVCPIYFVVMMVYCVDRGSGVKPWFPERSE